MTTNLSPPSPRADVFDTAQSWRMFDRIAQRYDLLNRLLSFRRDVAWRKRLCAALPERPDQHVLDLATGTGDVLLALLQCRERVGRVTGLDRSANMLALARHKIRRLGTGSGGALVRGDACRIGAADGSFDAVTMAFGIRNVPDAPGALREIYRVLKPGGRVVILEFALPSNRLFRAAYLAYFRHMLPRIGGLISGDSSAYRYLNRTVEAFPYGGAFGALLSNAGFERVSIQALTFGIAALYVGDKPR